jgi:hypothetical protein
VKKYNNVREVNGQDLIVGNTYYLDRGGRDKAIFEGVVIGQDSMRCLFTPIGDTHYILYTEREYKGQYVGKFSIWMGGNFFEETQSDTHL